MSHSTGTCLHWRRDHETHGHCNPEVRVQPNSRTQSVLLDLKFCSTNSRFFFIMIQRWMRVAWSCAEQKTHKNKDVDFWCLENACHRKQLNGRACLCYLRTEDLEEMLERVSNRISTVSFCPSPWLWRSNAEQCSPIVITWNEASSSLYGGWATATQLHWLLKLPAKVLSSRKWHPGSDCVPRIIDHTNLQSQVGPSEYMGVAQRRATAVLDLILRVSRGPR